MAYQTACTMTHKLRHGLSEDPARPLRGFLEADETFIGGRGDPTSETVRTLGRSQITMQRDFATLKDRVTVLTVAVDEHPPAHV